MNTVREPESQDCFKVQFREEWFDGYACPWVDSPAEWPTLEEATKELDFMIKRKQPGKPAWELRIVKTVTSVVSETRVAGGPG